MNTVLKTFLSMSFSGSLLILALFSGKRFFKDKISRQWQYYIWLIVIVRLLLPFGPEISLMGKIYQTIDRTVAHYALLPRQHSPSGILESAAMQGDITAYWRSSADPARDMQGNNSEKADSPAEGLTAVHPLQDILSLLVNHIWLIWLGAAAGMLIRKITIYQSFILYINSGLTPVSDIEILDRLSVTAQQAGIKRPVELSVNPLISSPLLTGFFHPCIVLPGTDIPEKDFEYIILHELTHYKRGDMFYKWLAQVTVCLHWFNPLVYLMSREITKACEFSCDEAVLSKTGGGHAQDYGKTLLDAMAAVGRYRENTGAVTLNENRKLLEERLSAIMSFKKKSRAIRLLTGALTLCILLGASFIGVYPAEAAASSPSADPVQSPAPDVNKKSLLSTQAEQYYEAGSLPLFQIVFSQLDEDAQSAWLDKIYEDGETSFFSVSVTQLDGDSPLIERFANKLYRDNSISFFSVLTNLMSREMLEEWRDKALTDQKWNFQSVLYSALKNDQEWDDLTEEWEKEWEKKQLEEYQAVGVTKNGKNYYYQGELVNIFLDTWPDKSFYTLDMNPAGTVNIKIIRNEDGQTTGVVCMTDAEITGLLGDMSDPDDE